MVHPSATLASGDRHSSKFRATFPLDVCCRITPG
jgi:hypothetical protein